MAVRLNVIMNHSPPPAGAAQQLGEAIIGELIGRPGIDLTLVGPFSGLPDGSTDRLRLESIAGDVAVLDWQSPEEIVSSLATIGFLGGRTPHPGDPDPPPVRPPTRRIYVFDLRRYRGAEAVGSHLAELLAGRQTRTFSLGSAAPPRPRPPAGEPDRDEDPSPRPGSPPVGTDSVGTDSAGGAKTRGEAVAPGSPGTVDLDALLNELDDLDP